MRLTTDPGYTDLLIAAAPDRPAGHAVTPGPTESERYAHLAGRAEPDVPIRPAPRSRR